MKLVTSLLVTLAAGSPAQAPSATELHFGNEPWHLALALGDLKPTRGIPSSADRQVFTYRNDDGVMLSVIVQKTHKPATLESCRNLFTRRKTGASLLAGIRVANEVQGQRGEAATQEYDMIAENPGETIVHHNVFNCRIRGTYYIDVHASKMRYQPSDRPALLALVGGVAIVP